MKTVLITSFHNFTARNILGAPFLKMLTGRGIRAVIIVPEGKVLFYEKEFGGENIVVHGVPGRLRRTDVFFKSFGMAAMRTRSLNIMRQKNIGVEPRILQKLFFWAPLFKRCIPFLYKHGVSKNAYADIFEKYQPLLLFATDAFSSVDNRLLHEARYRGVTTVSMVRSWDNLTTKGIMRVIPDVLVVGNEILKKEAIRYHGVKENRIAVVGIPHHDRYGSGPKKSWKDFVVTIGGDEKKKLVLYAALGDEQFSDYNCFDAEVIDMLVDYIPPTHQLLVRFPPALSVTLDKMQKGDKVLFERPGVAKGGNTGNFTKNELGMRDDDHLIDTLFYADVVISVTTTLLLDAVLCDRPTIVINFNNSAGVWQSEAPSRVLEYIHMQPLLKSGGVRVVSSPGALRAALEEYIKEPATDHEGRVRVRKELAYMYDGKSSERLCNVITKLLV